MHGVLVQFWSLVSLFLLTIIIIIMMSRCEGISLLSNGLGYFSQAIASQGFQTTMQCAYTIYL